MEVAFEDLCSRFDLYLKRLRADGDTQRELVILVKITYETTRQSDVGRVQDYRAPNGVQ